MFVKTHYSDSLIKPENLEGLDKTLILTDKTLGGAVKFYKACKEYNIKPILGYSDREIFLAKNKEQWKELLKGFSNETIPKTLCLVGAPFLGLWNLVQEKSYPPKFVDNTFDIAKEYIEKLRLEVDKVYLCLSQHEGACYDAQNELCRDLAEALDLPLIPYRDSFYVKPEAVRDHKIIIANKTKIKLSEWETMDEEFKRFHTEDFSFRSLELGSFLDQFEDYNILSSPKLPVFKGELPPDELFKTKLREGWKRLIGNKSPEEKKVYEDRIKHEIDVLCGANLSSYFLILADMMEWCNNQGWLVGAARGSAGGCLSSYLLGIIKIDPIKFGLLFERFYSIDRKGSMPDVDVDVPKAKREECISYIRNKYGHESVCQMATFMELQGRSSLKVVLRFNEACGFEQMNEITELIPELAKVEDQMEAVGETSLLKWTLQYLPDRLSQYARYENGVLVGDFAEYFEQAIRLEGVIVGTGKHASAVIVYDGCISDVCPMIHDKNGEEKIAGFSMEDGEAVGLVKLDILGLSTLDKIMLVMELVKRSNPTL